MTALQAKTGMLEDEGSPGTAPEVAPESRQLGSALPTAPLTAGSPAAGASSVAADARVTA
eukprot:CAMPEP_0197672764 /NCGR_PEP_ID=MMETSP1338-20131121/79599_1 /TAXON_ID=43686 ORGANISM="Pelagodinium beii, Strain RCC1491" /NCGR_SAMPLE_ID=MMETSP1338 /ASSEMBLY_ACC=CAM_ASM_000754 /LENGTH=59 /DNA_ID=CAMNT_0043252907 /DNA_START=23 /DNA_END=198 /DNA_ORIENTATION=+